MKAGRVERIEIEDRGGTPTVVGVLVDGEMIPCDSVVIAMGPWSAQAAEGLGLPPMYGQKYHSVLVQNHRELSQSVFFQGLDDPEVYPRPKGEVYITGLLPCCLGLTFVLEMLMRVGVQGFRTRLSQLRRSRYESLESDEEIGNVYILSLDAVTTGS